MIISFLLVVIILIMLMGRGPFMLGVLIGVLYLASHLK